jgi:predicted transcriptional regulator
MTSAVLNVKIDQALKEKLRHYAEENNENLSTATEKLLLLAFQSVEQDGVSEGILITNTLKKKVLLH